MKNSPRNNHSLLITLLLGGAFVWSLTGVPWGSSLVHSGGYQTLVQLTKAMVTPDVSPEILLIGLHASWKTLAYATCGMTLAVLIGVPLGVLASGVTFQQSGNAWLATGFFRPLLSFMRSIHELVWAWLFVAALGLSPLAAIMAIMIPYAGILGRIMADLLNDVPEEPLQVLQSSGANPLQTFLYGRLPHALADIVSYTLYRFECSVRSAAIMSFVGLGGIGYQIQISLDDLHFSETWTFIYMLIALILVINIWSSETRKALTQ
ncbi:MAG: PhnE/PtxC family ABC transporter permease [bacterium]